MYIVKSSKREIPRDLAKELDKVDNIFSLIIDNHHLDLNILKTYGYVNTFFEKKR